MKKIVVLARFSMLIAGLVGIAAGAFAQDAAAGKKKADMCMGCHDIAGYRAGYPEVYRVPKIAGQNEKYIIAALQEYKKGGRKFASMRAVAESLSDQDMADLAAYFHQLGQAKPAPDTPPAPDAAVAKLVAKANCTSCHGANFSKPIDPSYPKLAGQYPDYLYAALRAYQTDGNRIVGRNNPIMMGMARMYTPKELQELSDYIGSLPSEIETAQAPEFR